MPEWSGFFDAHLVDGEYDRTYLAEHFAKYFSRLVGNGVFAESSDSLQVFQASTANMTVVVAPGRSWIDGYAYENDSDLIFTLSPADGSLDRIDVVVNQWSSLDRAIKTVVKTGTPAINPIAPSIQRDADYKELKLAEIKVPAGATKITQSSIIDYRANTSVCGWVTGIVSQVDTSTLFAQWETAYEEELTRQREAWENFFEAVSLDLGIPVPSLRDAGKFMQVNARGDGYTLSKITEESSEYPGCYYRVVNNQIEWINPPTIPGVEYRTEERYQGKPVYLQGWEYDPPYKNPGGFSELYIDFDSSFNPSAFLESYAIVESEGFIPRPSSAITNLELTVRMHSASSIKIYTKTSTMLPLTKATVWIKYLKD